MQTGAYYAARAYYAEPEHTIQPVAIYPPAPPPLPSADWCYRSGFEAGMRARPQMQDASTQTLAKWSFVNKQINPVKLMSTTKVQQGSPRVFDVAPRGSSVFDAVEGVSLLAAN